MILIKVGRYYFIELERITGIEPVSLAWEAKVIPLYDIRFTHLE